MIILHIDMDAFFASIEERDNPELKGKPVVIGADPKAGKGRGVVSTANYPARKYGIHSAMPISIAYRLCPDAVFLRPNIEKYKKVSDSIMKILLKYSPLLEQVSIDEAYLGLELDDYDKAIELAKKIKKEIYETEKLTASIGVAPNKLVAKIASDHQKPDGLTVVRPEEVEKFLAKKPVSAIPGIGPKSEEILRNEKVLTIEDLRKISLERLIKLFGKRGIEIYNFARGRDDRPIVLEHERKSIGKQITFEEDVKSASQVIETALELLKEVFEEAKQENFNFSTLVVIIRYADFETHTAQQKLKSKDFSTLKTALLRLILKFVGKKKVRLVGVRVRE